MTKIYSPEELNSFSRETLVAVILSMQDQLAQLNTNMERLIEQIAGSHSPYPSGRKAAGDLRRCWLEAAPG